ncbi:MAG: NYN domain-containing protein [Actinomycetota bacterium]
MPADDPSSIISTDQASTGQASTGLAATDQPPADHDAIEHGALRSAIEFALLVAAEGRRRWPALRFPDELRPHLDGRHVSKRALARLRRAIAADPEFRRLLGVGLDDEQTADLVDEGGTLWLQRPAGWTDRVDELLHEQAAEAERLAAARDARREEKRRVAAEAARDRAMADVAERDERLARAAAELEAATTELDALRARLGTLTSESDALRVETQDLRRELRHARDREHAAVERLRSAEADRDEARAALSAAGDDDPTPGRHADRADAAPAASPDLAEMLAAADAAAALAERLRTLVPHAAGRHDAGRPGSDRHAVGDGARAGDRGSDAGRPTGDTERGDPPQRRTRMRLPGGLISTSAAAAEHIVRSDAVVLVDGYNVSKSTWPERSLQQQRTALLDAADNLARRYDTELTVVFDGADVVGAHADRRRLVRVVYSPDGVSADDVIRSEVRRLPASRFVAVVTDDREIIRDVGSWGANVVPSNAFAALL